MIDTKDAPMLQYAFAELEEDNVMGVFGLPMMIENTSHQCSSDLLLNCESEEKPLWWLVLRWMKFMLLKMASSYHAKPLLLAILPLLVGGAIGFFIGKLQISATQSRDTKHHLRSWGWRDWCSILSFRMGLVLASFLSNHPESEKSNEVFVNESSKDSTTILEASSDSPSCVGDHRRQPETNDVCSGLESRETKTRQFLKSDKGTARESGVPTERVPQHIAVIMDGNRRYGKAKYGSAARGHWDGSSKLVEFAKWCIAEKVAVLTVFAFSSENWNRDPSEIASLMQIFAKYCDELRVEAIDRNIKIKVLSTDYEKVPGHVKVGVKRMVEETKHCDGMIMNICLSYGSRGEIVGATQSIVKDALRNKIRPEEIDERVIGERLLTHNYGGDPDVLIRTSGEVRISNFLLWQLAYTEFFFVEKPWPSVEKQDLLDVIRTYARGRSRRYGR